MTDTKINETIILLTYFYDYELRNRPLMKYAKTHMGFLPWDLYLLNPLKEKFSKVVMYDYLERISEIGIKAMNQEIIDLVRKEKARYVLWTSFHYDVLGSTLEAVRKEGTITAGWFFDDEWRFDDYSKFWTPYLDYCVTNAATAVPRYKQLGANVIYTIPNTGIAVECDFSKIVEKYEVSFVGRKNYADREFWIDELEKRGIKASYFGEGFNIYIPFEEMLEVFGTSKINLNFSKGLMNGKPQLKGRVFQVCMAGGFLLTEYAPGIEEFFEIGKEIVCFNTPDEMADKIKYYLTHDTERREIARAGWERACREYTSTSMVAKVFDQIHAESAGKKGISKLPVILNKKPWRARAPEGQYHLEWAKAYIENNYGSLELWKSELKLAVSVYPFSIGAWYYSCISILPASMRKLFIRLWLDFDGVMVRYTPFTGLRRVLSRFR